MAKAANILVAKDDFLVRRGLRSILEEQNGWKIVGEADGAEDAVVQARRLRPDIVILGLTAPKFNELGAAIRIQQIQPHAKILVLSHYVSWDVIDKAFQAGVGAYILQTDAEPDLVAAIKSLLQGETFLSPRIPKHDDRFRLNPYSPLTSREREIVQLLADGNSNRRVGEMLGISERTVENHRAQILRKLGLASMSDLVRYALRNGMIEP